jgi:hypothetical protein
MSDWRRRERTANIAVADLTVGTETVELLWEAAAAGCSGGSAAAYNTTDLLFYPHLSIHTFLSTP